MHVRNYFSLVLSVVVIAAGCSEPSQQSDNMQQSEVEQSDATVFTNFSLIDVLGEEAVPGSAMIVDEGNISWTGPAAELEEPAGAEVVDLGGRFIMPGMIDLHIHLAVVEDFGFDHTSFTRDHVEEELGTYASYGVTSVMTLGTDKDLIFDRIEEQRSGQPSLTRVYTAAHGIVYEGGYGGVEGINDPVSTVEEVEQYVAEQSSKGADVIKLWVDDEFGTMPTMPAEISQAAIDAAHEHGLPAVAHIFYLEDAKRLVEQGIDGLAHGVRDQAVDEELLTAMRDQGVWQVSPTLSREAYMFAYGEQASFLDDPFFTFAVPDETLEQLASPEYQESVASGPHFDQYEAILETSMANLKRMVDAEVNYAFGTDSGPPGRIPGYSAHWELELMVEAGLTPAQAIRAATANAAQFLEEDNLGTLARSKAADFVVLNDNPLEDITNTRNIHSVYIAGKPVDVEHP